MTQPAALPGGRPPEQAGLRALARDPVLLGLAVLALGLVCAYLLEVGSASARLAAFWPVQVGLDIIFCVLAGRVARLPVIPVKTRRFWRATVFAGVLFTIGDSSQIVIALRNPGWATVGGSNVQTTLVAAGAACVVWAMLTHPTQISGHQRVRLWLDTATIMTGAVVFIWDLSLNEARTAGMGRLIVAVAGAGVMLVCAFGLVRLVLSGNAPFTRPAGITASISATLVGLSSGLSTTLVGPVGMDLSMAARLLPCILLAAAPRIQEQQLRADPSLMERRQQGLYSRAPYVAVAATHGLLVHALTSGDLGVRVWGDVAGTILITALVVVRQLVAFTDNHRLLVQLSHQEHRFRSLLQHSSDLILIADAAGAVTYTSPAVYNILGVAPEHAVGRPLVGVVHPDDVPQFQRQLAHVLAAPLRSTTTRLRVRHTNHSWRWLEVVSTNLLDDPSVGGIICNARDVTELLEFQDRLQYEATHDPLTQLDNRTLFQQRIEEAAVGATQDVAVLAVDLDDFKVVNDSLGHHVGDGLLVVAATRMLRCVRPTDTVARLGGDEFAVLLPATCEAEAIAVARRILDSLAEPAQVESHQLGIRASIGVATGLGSHARGLLRAADAAMYQAKQDGKGTFVTAHRPPYVGVDRADKPLRGSRNR